jgi:hypothetical protein
MEVEYFFNREEEYEDWCKRHPNGYIFNHAGGSTGNVFHVVGGCRHLNNPSKVGTYTTRYPKYCFEDLKELSETADQVSKPYEWRKCTDCFK